MSPSEYCGQNSTRERVHGEDFFSLMSPTAKTFSEANAHCAPYPASTKVIVGNQHAFAQLKSELPGSGVPRDVIDDLGRTVAAGTVALQPFPIAAHCKLDSNHCISWESENKPQCNSYVRERGIIPN